MTRALNIVGAIAAVSLLLAGVAYAASLNITTAGLGAGNAGVSGCVASSLTATRTVDNSGNITGVTVTNVPQACSGQTLWITLRDSGGASLGGASSAIGACTGGCSLGFSTFNGVSAANVAGYSFTVHP